MSTATPKEVRDALQITVDKINGESGQRNAVIRALALLGHRKPPQVVSGRLDGSAIRLYQWHGTPAGDIILATGAAFTPRILSTTDIGQAQPGVYILAAPDSTKAGSRSSEYAEKWRPKVKAVVPAHVPREVVRAVERAVERVQEAPPPATKKRSGGKDKAAAEKAELAAALKTLLG